MTTELRSTPDRRNLDFDDIVLVQREIVGRHYTRARQQHGSVGKRLRPAEISGQLVETALDIAEASLPANTDVPPRAIVLRTVHSLASASVMPSRSQGPSAHERS
jgi:hypothetical protein